MEWNRPARPNQAVQPTAAGVPAAHHGGASSKRSNKILPSRLVTVILLFAITVLIVAVISFLMFGKSSDEGKYVDKTKMQAVFLSGGQVYFGRISNLNGSYVRLGDIYYLRVNQQVQPDQKAQNGQSAQQDISLVKLGCELHGPQDEMLINREQVIFWENLKDDGQVAKAVDQYKKANPDGQKCQTGAQQSSGDAGTTTPTPTPSTNTSDDTNP